MRNGRQKSNMAATKFCFFDILTSDRGGDFPRIIEIALFVLFFAEYRVSSTGYKNGYSFKINHIFTIIHYFQENFTTQKNRVLYFFSMDYKNVIMTFMTHIVYVM